MGQQDIVPEGHLNKTTWEVFGVPVEVDIDLLKTNLADDLKTKLTELCEEYDMPMNEVVDMGWARATWECPACWKAQGYPPYTEGKCDHACHDKDFDRLPDFSEKSDEEICDVIAEMLLTEAICQGGHPFSVHEQERDFIVGINAAFRERDERQRQSSMLMKMSVIVVVIAIITYIIAYFAMPPR